MQTQRVIQASGPPAINNHCQNSVQPKPDLQHVLLSLSDLGLCHSLGSMWYETPLECVKSNSVTPKALMGKSWHLAVNEPLYSGEHLSQDQGLSLIWASSLRCRVQVRLMLLGTGLQKHWAWYASQPLSFTLATIWLLQILSFNHDLTLHSGNTFIFSYIYLR